MASRKRLSEGEESPKADSKKPKLIQTTLKFDTSTRPLCKYGAKCYRKHPDHLRAYRHPSPEKEEEESQTNEDEDSFSKPSESSPTKETPTTVAVNSTISLMELMELNDEKLLSSVYQMEFPTDLFEFWKFCSSISKNKPRGTETLYFNRKIIISII